MNGQNQGAGGPSGYPPPPGQQPGYPQQPGQPAPQRGQGPGFCPSCGSGDYRAESFTWWGGLLGPKMLSHVTCLGCGTGFNSKTGKSNNTAIGIYLAVGVVLAIMLFWFMLPALI